MKGKGVEFGHIPFAEQHFEPTTELTYSETGRTDSYRYIHYSDMHRNASFRSYIPHVTRSYPLCAATIIILSKSFSH